MKRGRYTQAELAGLPPPPEPIGYTASTEGRCLWWYADKGHGAIETEATASRDVWFSALEMKDYAELHEGQVVEVTYKRADQDSFRHVAIRVRPK